MMEVKWEVHFLFFSFTELLLKEAYGRSVLATILKSWCLGDKFLKEFSEMHYTRGRSEY